MRVMAKAGIAVLAGATVFAAAIALNPRSSEPRADARAPFVATSTPLDPIGPVGSLDASIAALQDRLRSIPDDWRALASLGIAYVAQARVTADPSWYPRAEDALLESLRLRGNDNVDARLGLGVLELARHDFEAALASGREAASLDPHDADAYGVIGDALVELGRYDEAFEAFQTMVDTRPDLASYARASYARELLGDVPGAVSAMELAFEAAGTPSDAAWVAHRLGELEFARGRVEAAARWYERGLELEPGYAPNAAGLANVAWARGDVDGAIDRYRDVVARYPSVEYAAALGDLYASRGEAGLADEQYAVVEATRALAATEGVNVDLEVAVFDADHGDAAAALRAADQEWARRESVHVADAYAWALYASGRYADAADMADLALALGTRNATFLFHAGMIERALGHDAAARRLLAEALALNPHFSILHAVAAADALADLEVER
jgi:tetratricopeptide (TPR) repeat protein